jgi:hypothetical protein
MDAAIRSADPRDARAIAAVNDHFGLSVVRLQRPVRRQKPNR